MSDRLGCGFESDRLEEDYDSPGEKPDAIVGCGFDDLCTYYVFICTCPCTQLDVGLNDRLGCGFAECGGGSLVRGNGPRQRKHQSSQDEVILAWTDYVASL